MNRGRLRVAFIVAASVLLAACAAAAAEADEAAEAAAASTAAALYPLPIFAFAVGALAGGLSRYSMSAKAIFLVPFAIYFVLALVATAVWTSVPEDFLYSIAYAVVTGAVAYTASFFVFRRLGHTMRKRRRLRERRGRRA
jgi:peptidoglycan/LPS O-acetylase OafA/YrhL